jgi:hypothetical protein
MKVKFGAIVVDGRGKIGGHVMSKNRAGAYMRTKVTPVNPNTLAQVAVRSRLSGRAIGWRGLTAAQRLQWNAAVASFSRTNIFGDIKQPTGFNLYVKLNSNLLNAGAAVISVPPLPQAVSALLSLVVTQAPAGATTLTFTATPIPANHQLIIRATAPVSPGKTFVKSEFRQIASLAPAQISPYVATVDYATKFGGPGLAGQKIFVEAYYIHLLTGQQGAKVQASCIVA